jgi:dTDP-4-amino-4,6-dideoxygalactose transaminase
MVLDQGAAYKRPAIMEALGKKGIGTSIYYPQPVPRMTYYKLKYGYEEKKFLNATAISDGIIALPVGPHLELSDMDYIIKAIEEVWSEMNV